MELRSEISKQYLSEALFLLLKKEPYKNISIQKIVEKAGMSRMAYYRNFDSKDEIVQFYLNKITNAFLTKTKINLLSLDLRSYLVTLFTHLLDYQELGLLLYKNDILHFVKIEFDKVYYNKAKNKPELYNYLFVSGGLFNVYKLWLSQGCKETPEELGDMLIILANIIK